MSTAKRHPSQQYPLEERIQLWEDQGRMCHYCDRTLRKPGTKGGRSTHLDHKEAHSKGGSIELSNLILCCRQCNLEKGPKSYSEYLRWKKQQAVRTLNRMNLLLLKR